MKSWHTRVLLSDKEKKIEHDKHEEKFLEDDEQYINFVGQTYRIAVIGKSFVGKTQLINRIVNNNFFEDYEPTEEE